MILYRRRIDYKMLLFTFTVIAILPLLFSYIQREILSTVFYFIILPLIFIISVIAFMKRVPPQHIKSFLFPQQNQYAYPDPAMILFGAQRKIQKLINHLPRTITLR